MQSTIQLYNLALARLGGEQLPTVVSTFEGDAVGALCQNLFPHVLDMTLAAYDWSFALKRATLAKVALESRAAPYRFCHALPADCVRPVTVMSAINADGNALRYILGSEGIWCDAKAADLSYVSRVSDPKRWPPLFADTLAWGLAGELASARVNNSQKQTMCYQAYDIAIAKAIASDRAMQHPQMGVSAWQAARHGKLPEVV